MLEALKNCPFCGGTTVAQGASREYISVWCTCGARGPEVPFPDDCIDPATPIRKCHDLWNRRAYLEAVGGEPAQAPAVRVKMKRCATEGCDNPASVYFERGGVGSHYCSGCGMKIESRSALEAETGGGNGLPSGKWEIDNSTGTPILVYDKCSVIESEQAYYLLGLIQRSATPPDERAVEALPAAVALGRKAVRGADIASETQGLIRDPLQNYVTIEDALTALAQGESR